jgi:hypothetical protein
MNSSKFGALSLAVALSLTASVALADERAKEVDAKMREYVEIWNRHDAAGVATKVYRLDNTANGAGTTANFQAQFDSLKAQGYDHSDLHSVEACLLSDNLALAEMRYTRLKTDGGFMPPKERATIYKLRKTPDGWRIAEILGGGATGSFSCKSPTAAAAPAR